MASLSRVLGALALLSAVSCTEPLEITPPGVYEATTYAAGPSATNRTDILALGVNWKLTINADRSVIDQWDVYSAGMESHTTTHDTAHREGNTVVFINLDRDDPFLSQRTWTLEGDQLVADGQVVNGINAVIRFTRRSNP